MKLEDQDIEQKIGQYYQSSLVKIEEMSLNLIKMPSDPQKILQTQEIDVGNKMQDMQEFNRNISIQNFSSKTAIKQEDDKDPQVKFNAMKNQQMFIFFLILQHENKLNSLVDEYKSIPINDRVNDLMKQQQKVAIKRVQKDKQIYNQQRYSISIATPKLSDNQNLRDRLNSCNKSMVSSTSISNRNNYDEILGCKDEQKLFSIVNSCNDLSQNQNQIASHLGLTCNQPLRKTSHFGQKSQNDKSNNINENQDNNQKNTTQANTKLYIAFPEEQIVNTEKNKSRVRQYLFRIGEVILIITMVVVLYILYQFYFK